MYDCRTLCAHAGASTFVLQPCSNDAQGEKQEAEQQVSASHSKLNAAQHGGAHYDTEQHSTG